VVVILHSVVNGFLW